VTSKERVFAAFEKQATDKVPVHQIGFSSDVASALLGREAHIGGGIQQWREAKALWQGEEAHQEFLERSFQDAIDIALLLNEDIIRPGYWRYPLKPTKRIDENTFLYAYGDEENWRVLRYDPPSEQCNVFYYKPKKLSFNDIEKDIAEREKTLLDYQPKEDDFAFDIRAQRLLGDERVVRVGGVGIGIPIREADIWLEAFLLRPDLVARHLNIQVEQAVRNVEFLVPLGFRYFFGGGDFASNDGPMYSPKLFRELVVPRLKRVSEVCHKHGSYHLFASDGNLWLVADDLFGAAGVDGYYEIDRRAGMDLGELRQRFPHLTLLGNISSHTVHLGTKEEVVEEAISCIEEAKRSRGIIVGVSNYFVPGTPVENVTVLLETIRQYR
jgi:uroporphyrinogen decarboxylase